MHHRSRKDPTNLDRDQLIDGLAPRTQAKLMLQAVADRWDREKLAAELHAQQDRRQVG